MISMLKFYHASGIDPQALLDQAEDQMNSLITEGLPVGASIQTVVPQLTHQGGRYELLLTVTLSLTTAAEKTLATWAPFRLRDSVTS